MEAEMVSGASPAPPHRRSKLYLSTLVEARRFLGKRITPASVVEHLLYDNRFHVLFPSMDSRSIGEDCRSCAKEIVAGAVAVRALKVTPPINEHRCLDNR